MDERMELQVLDTSALVKFPTGLSSAMCWLAVRRRFSSMWTRPA